MGIEYLTVKFHRNGRSQEEYELLAAEQEAAIAKTVTDLCVRKGVDLSRPPKLVAVKGDVVVYQYTISPPLYVDIPEE